MNMRIKGFGDLKKLFGEVEEKPETGYLAYDFIDIQPSKPEYSVKRKGNLSGTLAIQVEAITPIVSIAALKDETRDVQYNDPTLLPASSIRGMLRQAAEIIWDEALVHIKKKDGEIESSLRHFVPPNVDFSTTTLEAHRLASHLFGFTVDKKASKYKQKQEKPQSMASLLTFTDAKAITEVKTHRAFVSDSTLYSPFNFYEERTINHLYTDATKKRIAGRKVYLAGRFKNLTDLIFSTAVPPELAAYVGKKNKTANRTVDLIYPGTKYEFTIHYNQLYEKDLAALIRVIELTQEATHAIGRAKPLGLGRVKLQVTQIKKMDQADLFNLHVPLVNRAIDKAQLLKTYPDPYAKKLAKYASYMNSHLFDNEKVYTSYKNLQASHVQKYSRKGN